MPELAAARLTEPRRCQVADGFEHHAARSHPRGLVNLIANGATRVEPQPQGMANHRGSVLVGDLIRSWAILKQPIVSREAGLKQSETLTMIRNW